MMDTDEILVEKACAAPQGDLRAFEELVRRHQARVQTNCRYLSGNEEDSLDLAQEVLVKAYFNLNRFEGRSSFGTWIGRIKVNHCLNHLRRTRGHSFIDLEEPGLEKEAALHSRRGAEFEVEAGDQRALISGILSYMPETLRVPLIMRDMDEMSYQEIADKLEVGLSAVKMRIKRAREFFREAYGKGVPDVR
ncbi:MAG: sigma-70 family RNA polymerase sigma factor [Candidatus Krumholzibacteria bacterium]|nr:sigma-70 family RNA polymerase sigma factor [Candidatus Krumholzibacteria bacterium]